MLAFCDILQKYSYWRLTMANIVTVTDSGLITATENEIYQAIVENVNPMLCKSN